MLPTCESDAVPDWCAPGALSTFTSFAAIKVQRRSGAAVCVIVYRVRGRGCAAGQQL